jgi:small-conductance mechanosensitive channel
MVSQSDRVWQAFPKSLAILSLVVMGCILCMLFATPTIAQSNPTNRRETAPVMLDGRVLLNVGRSGDFQATERADRVNSALQQQVQSSEPDKITIANVNGNTTLRLNDRHLLTVTEQDMMPGIAIDEQTQTWKKRIEDALKTAREERTPTYFRQSLGKSLTVFGVVIALHLGLMVWHGSLRRKIRQSQPSKSSGNLSPQLLSLILSCLQVAIWLAALYYIMGLFPQARSFRCVVLSSFITPIIPLGEQYRSILDIVLLLASIVGLWLVVKWLIQIFKTRILELTGADRGIQDTIGVLIEYSVTFIGLLIILQTRGINVASLAVLASAFGVGIGFGLQNIANNFISGLILAFSRPIKVGDFIKLGDLVGTVERIGSRSTEIITLNQVSIIVPNSRFVENEIINWSHGSPVSQIDVPVGVAYGSNIQKVRKALLEVAKGHPEILRHPAPKVSLREFGDNSLNFILFVWIREPQKQFKYRNELNQRIYDSFTSYGIEIPFPQRDLNLRSPQLERMITAWMRQNTSPEEFLDYLNSLQPNNREEIEEEGNQTQNLSLKGYNLVSGEIDLDALVEQMRGPDGLEIKTHRFGLKSYPNTFVGSEAVCWLMRTQKSGVTAAIQLGQLLIDRDIIHHVLDEHNFKNEYLFYRFYLDEN